MPADKYQFGVWVWGTMLLTGAAGEVYTLYYLGNPAARLAAGPLFAALIVASLLFGFDSLYKKAEPRRRRFFKLRIAVDMFVSEVTRLNWLFEGQEDPRTAAARSEEIDVSKERLHGLLDQIILAAGQVGPQPECDASFQPESQPSTASNGRQTSRRTLAAALIVVSLGVGLLLGRSNSSVQIAPVPIPIAHQDTVFVVEELPFRPIPYVQPEASSQVAQRR